MPQIEVSFDIDANGILNVSARDKATGKSQSIRIEASSGLSEREIDKMVNDAKQHEAEDHKKKEEVDLRNQADQLVWQTEKNLKEYGDRLDADTKAKVEAATERVKAAIKDNNVPEIRSSMEALNTVWHEAAGKMYQGATADAQESQTTQRSSSETEVDKDKKSQEAVDADYEVVS